MAIAEQEGQKMEDRWWEQFPLLQHNSEDAVVPKPGAPGEYESISRDEYVGRLLEKNQKAIQLERDRKEAKDYVENALPGQVLAGQVLVDLTSPIERMIGMGERADEMNRFADLTEQAIAEQEKDGPVPDILQRGFRGAIRSLVSAFVGAKIGGKVGGPAFAAPSAIGMAAVQEGNRAITEGRDAGLEGAQLAAYAASQGVIEALPAAIMQRAGLGGFESLVAGQAVKSGVRQGVIDAIKRTGMEIPEEVVTEVGHLMAKEISRLDPQALSSESLSATIADTVVQTVMTMGLAEGGQSVGNAVRRWFGQQDDEAALQAERDKVRQERERLAKEQESTNPEETVPTVDVPPEGTATPPAGEQADVPPTAKPREEVIRDGKDVQQGNAQGDQEGLRNEEGGQGQVGVEPVAPDSPTGEAGVGDTMSPTPADSPADGAEGGRTSPPSAPTQDQQPPIGKNADGEDVYENEKGVRSVSTGKVRIDEKVTLRPQRRLDGGIEYVGEVDVVNREDRFKTVDETQTESRPAGETQIGGPPEGDTVSPQAPAPKVDKEGFAKFTPDSGTLGIPRAEMPQVTSEQRGALSNFARARGVEYERVEVLPTDLKPSQAEYSPEKVQRAREFEGPERAILVSQDGYVVDGHHQWKRNLEDRPSEPMEVIRLGTDAKSAIDLVREFPSSQTSNETAAGPRRLGDQPAVESGNVSTPAAEGDTVSQEQSRSPQRQDETSISEVAAIAKEMIDSGKVEADAINEARMQWERQKKGEAKYTAAFSVDGEVMDTKGPFHQLGALTEEQEQRLLDASDNNPESVISGFVDQNGKFITSEEAQINAPPIEMVAEYLKSPKRRLGQPAESDTMSPPESQASEAPEASSVSDKDTPQLGNDTVSPESTAEIPQLEDADIDAFMEGLFDEEMGTQEAAPAPKPAAPPRRLGQPEQEIANDRPAMPEGFELTAPGELPAVLRGSGMRLKPLNKWAITSGGGSTIGQGNTPQEAISNAANDEEMGHYFADMTPKPPAKPPTKIEQARDTVRKKKEDLYKQWNDEAKGKLTSGLDPSLAKLAFEIAVAEIQDGTLTFAAYVENVAGNVSAELLEKAKPYFESAWRVAHRRGMTQEPAGKFDDVLKQKQVNDGRQLGQRGDQEGEAGGGGVDANTEVSEGGGSAESLGEVQPGDDQAAEGSGDSGRVRGGDQGTVREGGSRDGETGTDGGVRGGTATPGDAADGTRTGAKPRGTGRRGRDANVEGDAGVRGDGAAGDGTGTDKAPTSVRPNFHLTDPEKIVGGGQKTKFERNRKAIEIVQDIEQTGRAPSQEELDTLAAYTGWGAFGQELFQGTWDRPMPKDGWQDQDEWLRSHLGEEEWRSAQQSIVNAHYTDPETVQGMWDMLRTMGFKGGRVLEPSMGVGNFFAMMPRDMMNRSTLTGIELDNLTARIAKILYPQANIQQKGYQESETPNDFYDLVISNVPFGNYKISDRRYRQDFSIHNYFFRRGMDHVKPGGIVAFLTSNMTMDGSTQAKILRQQLSEMADVVGVYRFPSGAFQKYAGTKVVADLIVLRKRKPGEEPKKANWIEVIDYMTPAGKEIKVNEYWVDNPENIMGTMDFGTGTTSGRPGMIVRQPDDLSKLWGDIVSQAPKKIFNTERSKNEGLERPNTRNLRQNTVVAENKDLYIAKGEQLLPLVDIVKWKGGAKKKETVDAKRKAIEDLLGVRDILQQVLEVQGRGEDAAEQRKQLNDVYDKFVAKHGFISDSDAYQTLSKAGDPLATSLKGIESPLPDGGYEKRPIFTRSTVRTKKKPTNLTLDDALALARNESVDIDWDLVAKAANITRKEAIDRLEQEGKIFKIGDDQYDAADVFLSGNMARKIRMLEAAQAEGVNGLDRSLEAAREALPDPVAYTQIEVNLGAPWIEATDYSEFVSSLLNEPAASIEIARGTRGWKVSIPTAINSKPEATTMHGSGYSPFSRIVAAALNNSTITIRFPDPMDPSGKKMVVDEAATAEVNGKINDLKGKFKDWIWTNQDRTQRLTKVYNEEFNSTVTPTYENVPLVFEGLALQRGDDPFSLRQHQESAVYRGIVSGKGLFAHEVGTGKTLTMGALAMESRRLGLANKPVLLGHNANAPSVAREIQEAYPNSKILYIDNLDPKTRDETLGAIATEDWDLIVIPHSLVDRFKMRPETLERMLKREMDELEAAAYEAFDDDDGQYKGTMPTDLDNVSDEELKKLRSPTAKELVKERMKLRKRIIDAHAAVKGGKNIFFEDMGIDMVMVDEAHLFKKLPISTKQRLKGLNTVGSQRGTMLMLLTDFVREQTGGRGTYLFTGTPITNTINEIYNMMRFVMPNEMESAGVRDWDSWFNTFATGESNLELSSGGTFETFDRLSSFINLPELRQMVGQYMDIVFADQMPEFHDRDSRDGRTENPVGRPFKQIHNETLVMSDAQKEVSDDLKRRYTEFRNAKGKLKREMMKTREFNPLVIEGEGVKLALDPRLIDALGENKAEMKVDPKDPRLKINRMIQNAMVHYRESETSTQMIFMQTGHSDYVDRTVGKDANGKDIKQKFKVFNLAKEIKRRLIEEGVPENEIVIMSAINGREKRKEVADKMQRGEVRFAIGSTETMGTGVNAQNEMVAMHHLDAPWMPGDLEQRNGRGHRQGNRWNTVHEYRYLTEGPQDGRRWQVLLTKDRFIKRFMRADGSERSIDMDDIDLSDEGETNDMEQTFSAAAGDPRLMMRAKLEKDIEKMDAARHRFYRAIQDSVDRARQRLDFVTMAKERIAKQQADYDTFVASRPAEGDTVSLKIRDQVFEGREAIDDALKGLEERYRNSIMPAPMDIGEYRGLTLKINNSQLIIGESMTGVKYSLQSVQQTMTNMPNTIAKAERQIAKDEEFIKLAESNVGQPFPRQAQLDAKRKKLTSLLNELEQNPQGSPSWFRNTAPVGSSFFHEGKEYEVAGHRGDTHILREQDGEIIAVPAEEITDEQGTPLFPMLKEQQDAEDSGEDQPPASMAMAVAVSESNTRRLGGGGSGQLRNDTVSPKEPEPIRQADIVTTWSRLFGVPIRIGGYKDKRGKNKVALGIYNHLSEIVRMREGNAFDIIVASHEIGHHLDKMLNLYNRNAKDSKLKQLRKENKAKHSQIFAQLQALDIDHPRQSRVYEGIAEAVRQIITGTAVNARVAPQAVAWVEEQIMADPKFGPAMKQAIEQAKQYQDQGAINRARMVFGGPPLDLDDKARRRHALDRAAAKMYELAVDRRHTLSLVDADIAAKRPLRSDEASIYEMVTVFDSRVNAMSAKALQDGVHTIDGEKISDATIPVAQKLLNDNEYTEDADAYMVARFGLTMPESYNFGMDRQDAQEYVDWVESDPDRAQRWQEYHRLHSDYFNALVELEVRDGDLSREEADRIMGTNKDLYVPLMREMGDSRFGKTFGGGSQMIELPKRFQRRTKSGSGRPVMPILQQAVLRTRHHYSRVVRQQIHNKIVDQITSREGLGKWLSRIDPRTAIEGGKIEAILQQLVEKGIVDPEFAFVLRQAQKVREGGKLQPDAIDRLADYYELDRSSDSLSLESEIEALLDVEPDITDVVLFYKPDYRRPNGMYVIKYMRGDKPELYEVDPDFYDTLLGLPEEAHNFFNSAADWINSKFKTGAVGVNTAFAVSELFRNAQTFAVNSKFATGSDRVTKTAAWTAAYVAAITHNPLVHKPNELVEVYREWGGELFSYISADPRGAKKTARRLGAHQSKESMSAKDYYYNLADRMEDVVDRVRTVAAISDVGPRLAEAEAYLKTQGFEIKDGKFVDAKTGKPKMPTRDQFIKAMYQAADVTYNYRRTGKWVRPLERLFPFFNASVQGMDKRIRVYRDTLKGLGKKKGVERDIAKQAFLAMMSISTLYLLIKYAMMDEEEEMDQWEKDGYLSFKMPGMEGRLSMAMSREHAWLANGVLAGIRTFANDEKDALGDYFRQEASNAIPFGLSGAVGTSIEGLMNYDYFRGRPIVPNHLIYGDSAVSPRNRYDEQTTELSKLLGKANIFSPMMIDHLLTGYTGGAYKRWATTAEKAAVPVLQAMGTAEKADTQPWSGRDMPGLKAIYRDNTPNASVNEFYDELGRISKEINDLRVQGQEPPPGLVERGQMFANAAAVMQLLRESSGPEYDSSENCVAIARDILGKSDHANYPHPFYVDIPEEAAKKLREMVFNDLDNLSRDLGRPSKSPEMTDEEYEKKVMLYEARREGDRKFWERHADSPIVQETLKAVKSQEKFRDTLFGRSKPRLGNRPFQEFAEDFRRFGQQQEAAREFLRFGQGNG